MNKLFVDFIRVDKIVEQEQVIHPPLDGRNEIFFINQHIRLFLPELLVIFNL